MEPDVVEHRLVAILSADAVGFSRLIAEDEAGTVRRLTAYRDEIRLLVQQHRGRVVDTAGDNLLAEFPSASEAVRCAVEAQRVVGARNADVGARERLEFRMGVHLGEVRAEADRIYGDGVNIAARLEALADPGGVCVSAAVHEQIHAKLPLRFEDLGDQSFKNIPYSVRVYRWEADAPERTAGRGIDLSELAGRSDVSVFVVPTVWVLYVAIVLEILFMISPFALYYYSAYGPSLNVLHSSPITAWLTTFFLPHFSETTNPVLNFIRQVGPGLIGVGLLLFVVSFVQLYWSKLQGREAVMGGLYRWVRHPQYAALALTGLGTLLVWPRFLILVCYITMLFLYTSLARFEEARCLQNFGDSYRVYRESTGMFVPGRWFRGLRGWLPRSGGRRIVAAWVLYAGVTGSAILAAYGLRDYSLSQVSTLYEAQLAAISPAVLSDTEMSAALEVARTSGALRDQLAAQSADARWLVYVMPEEWVIQDIPMYADSQHTGHYQPSGFDRRRYKVLFTRIRTHASNPSGDEIIKSAYGRDPILMVGIDTETQSITSIETPPPHVEWGDIPTPLF